MSRPNYGSWILNGKMPRSTKYSRQKRNNQLQSQELQSQEVQENQQNEENVLVIPCFQEGNTSGNDTCSSLERIDSMPDSLSTADEESSGITVPKVKRRKRRKLSNLHQSAMSDTSSSESVVEINDDSDDSDNSSIIGGNVNDLSSTTETGHFKPNNSFTGCSSERTQTLCPCTGVTSGDIVFMVLSLGVRHSLTWDAQVDVLKMVSTVFEGKNTGIPTSKYLYFKSLGVQDLPITSEIFCNFCESYLGKKDDLKGTNKCSACESDININSPANSFVSLSLRSQLQTFLKNGDFVKNVMNYRFQRKTEAQLYNDVYDGAVYKSLSAEGGILSNPLNLSYTFFVDGMVFGPSSDKTIWPIYLTINELPYEERSKYLLLAGLYVGSKDPNLQMFLKPFVALANELSSEGVQWVHNDVSVISKVVPLCCVADSVARCKLMNFQSFSATYGCTFCYKESIHTIKAQKYPLGEPPALRTEESLLEDLQQVHLRKDLPKEEDRVYRGVKGVSPLYSLNYFKMSQGFVVDYMHCILLGVTKAHMEILFDAKNKNMWNRIDNERVGKKHLISLIDTRIKKMQSNSAIIRELRPASVMAQWKASEYRCWLLFLCIPCLIDLLKIQYLSHLALLSKAMYILLQKTLSHSDVTEVQRLLLVYSFYSQKYFGVENMTYNIHLLSHIAEGIFNFGPVVGHNSFIFEAQNRYIGQMCKSPFALVYQVARKFLVFRSLPTIFTKLVLSEEVMFFSEKILDYKKLKMCYKPFKGCSLLGKGTVCSLSPDEQRALHDFGSTYYEQCHQRMILKGKIYCTDIYCKHFQNNDSCLLMRNGDVVLLKHILVLPSKEVVILSEKLKVQRKPCIGNNHTKINHIKIAEHTGIIICASVQDVSSPCILMLSPTNNIMFSPIPYGSSVE